MNDLAYIPDTDLAERIRVGAIAERDLRNEIAGEADRADAVAAYLVNLSNRLHELAGELRSAAVAGVVL